MSALYKIILKSFYFCTCFSTDFQEEKGKFFNYCVIYVGYLDIIIDIPESWSCPATNNIELDSECPILADPAGL